MPETLTAACGHAVPFDAEPGTPYYAEKRAKVTGRPCRACRAEAAPKTAAAEKALALERRRAKIAAGEPVRLSGSQLKGQAVKLLPDGVELRAQRRDGRWHGAAWLADRPVASADAAGLMSVVQKLAVKVCQAGAAAPGVPT